MKAWQGISLRKRIAHLHMGLEPRVLSTHSFATCVEQMTNHPASCIGQKCIIGLLIRRILSLQKEKEIPCQQQTEKKN